MFLSSMCLSLSQYRHRDIDTNGADVLLMENNDFLLLEDGTSFLGME